MTLQLKGIGFDVPLPSFLILDFLTGKLQKNLKYMFLWILSYLSPEHVNVKYSHSIHSYCNFDIRNCIV